MKKRNYLIVCMIALLALSAISCQTDPVLPEVKANSEASLRDAIVNASAGTTIIVTDDIVVSSPVIIDGDKSITLDLNGKTISNTADLWNESVNAWSLISVRDKSSLVIKGNGVLKAKENDCYAVDLQDQNASVVIEGGTFIGNISAVYVYEGNLNVKGGTYSIQQKDNTVGKEYEFMLNCFDASYESGIAKITVSGGTFIKFNPGNCRAEGENTSFLADGFKSVPDGEDFKVIAE